MKPVVVIDGIFVIVVGLLVLAPGLVDALAHNPDARGFFLTAGIAFALGGAMVLSAWTGGIDLNVRQGFLLTASSWVLMALLAALPFMLGSLHASYTDAFFETMSGLTTTGSTVFSGLDHMPPGILLWRSMLQWIGGIGIIVTAVAMLPFLRVGGMQLFRMESSDKSDKVLPRAGQIAGGILAVYIGLTVLCAVVYDFTAMTPFEAINHAMTTVSTGGFSTSDQSIGHFRSPAIEWEAAVFMFLGALPFVLYVRALHGHWRDLLGDSQVRAFSVFLVAVSGALTAWLVVVDHFSVVEALRLAVFNVVSVVTTTGFATSDYTTWGSFALVTFFFITFVGGCTGSTAGGIKIFRFEIMALIIRRQIHAMQFRHAKFLTRYAGRVLSNDVMRSISIFVFQFAFLVAILTVLLSLTGLDMTTSFTGAATAMANVGPGLGTLIGPAGNFATLPDAAKWILSAGMLVGRLEIVTVLVLFVPAFWKS
ncbi:MAG: TrkH family potassium uptake protein [Alphaproteobacteria bacterium]|nr:TrkH family potassium uptake protein [Alphaproteobacteria bacterium]